MSPEAALRARRLREALAAAAGFRLCLRAQPRRMIRRSLQAILEAFRKLGSPALAR